MSGFDMSIPEAVDVKSLELAKEWKKRYFETRKTNTERGGLGLDTETTGLDKFGSRIVIWSMSDHETRLCIPVSLLHFFKDLLEDPETHLDGTNLAFDAHMLMNHGIDISKAGEWRDTANMSWLHNENMQGRHGLKETTKELTNRNTPTFEQIFGKIPAKRGGQLQITPGDLLLEVLSDAARRPAALDYAALDAYNSTDVRRRFDKLLRDEVITLEGRTLYDHFYEFEVPFTKILWKMERRGFTVDKGYLLGLRPGMKKDIESLGKKFAQAAGEVVNLRSHPQMRRFFFGFLQKTPVNWTKGGTTGEPQPSTDSESLERWAGEGCQYSQWALEHRSLAKTLDTYVDGIPTWLDNKYRVHASINGRLVTGRLSTSDPSLLNLPRPGEDPYVIREAFIAAEKCDLVVCVAPGTRILRTDLTWIRADEICPDDELIGFDEELSRDTAFKRSRVRQVKHLRRPCCRIVTDRGTVTSSVEHMWVVRPARGDKASKRRWVATQDLQPGDRISFFVEPWDVERSHEAGYLAGFFDGEGWLSSRAGVNGRTGTVVGFGQNTGPTRDYVLDLLRNRGFDIRFCKGDRTCFKHWVKNGDTLRFLGSIRPPRLLAKADEIWEGRRTWGRNNQPATIISVEKIGVQPVIAISTSTRTFIAEGFLSHNCDYEQLEMRLMAHMANDEKMIGAINKGVDLHCFTVAEIYGYPYEVVVEAVKNVKLAKKGKLGRDPTEEESLLVRLRQAAKATGFGIIYGIGGEHLAANLTRDLKTLFTAEQGFELVHKYFSVFPRVKAYIEEVKKQLWATGRVQTILGRFRRFGDLHGMGKKDAAQAQRQAVNSIIQGSAADIAKVVMIRAESDPELKECKAELLLQIHDELIFETPWEYTPRVKKRVKELMEDPFDGWKLKVPLPVEANSGYSWASCK